MRPSVKNIWFQTILFLSMISFVKSWNPPELSDNQIHDINNSPNRVQRSHSRQPVRQENTPRVNTDKEIRSNIIPEAIQPVSQIIESKETVQGIQNSLIQNDVNLPQSYNAGFESIHNSVLSRKSLNDFILSDILIAADIEGGIHAVNRENGQVLWSILSSQFNPLIEIKEPPRNSTKEILMVEPFEDGNIYFFNMHQGLQKIPVSIKQLILTSPMHMKANVIVDDMGTVVEDEKIYTGSRRTVMYTIDIKTGEIISVFGPGTANKNFRESISDNEGNLLVLGKTIYELGIHSKDGSTYNVTYATWQTNTLHQHLAEQNLHANNGILIAPFRDKTMLAIDYNLKIAKWISPKFPGIITSVFDVFVDGSAGENIIVPHQFQTMENDDNIGDHIYLEETENHSWIALSSQNFPSLVKAAPISKYSSSEIWRAPSIFDDEPLFRDAISGVHSLATSQFKPTLALPPKESSVTHNRPSNALMMIEPNTYNNFPSVKEDTFNSLERYISPMELELYRLKLEEQITRQIMAQNKHSFLHTLGNLMYKVFESGFIILASLALLGLLQKFNITPPFPVILEKLGLVSPNEEDASDTDPSDTKLLNTEKQSNKNINHVNFKDNEKENENEDEQNEGEKINTENDTGNNLDNGKQIEKKKRKRGSRGGKKNKSKKIPQNEHPDQLDFETDLRNLTVSDTILGYGSSGTIVFKGSFQGRDVAVKRMLIDFCDVADREIQLLTESDNHPNVIRYYCSERTDRFLYIALELCTATLQDLIYGRNLPVEVTKINKSMDLININYQIASGVAHLHSLKIIHRDLKPQNILVSINQQELFNPDKAGTNLRILISDFGLCKKLDNDQSSFKTNINNPAGTTGWRAPELLEASVSKILESITERNEDTEHSTDHNTNSMSVVSTGSFYDPFIKKRLTRAIDIFSLGCVFFYVLTKGQHPYGDRYMREANIIKGIYDLSPLKTHIIDRSNAVEAIDLISRMISKDARNRPTAFDVLKHPLFWPASKKLAFLLKVSDRFEVERRDPPSSLLLKLETISPKVIVDGDWSQKFDKAFMDNLGKYRKYHYNKIMDLLRSLRNKYHHFMDLPEDLAKTIGPIPNGFYNYFSVRFPNLLMEIYLLTKEVLEDDQMLKEFF
ncbi:similar to Saccharomyces cerevisiae YHR079C IRE1 Serine-threonine kinase and endoribonuclease [Maudiozyma barnettii]|uniref:non-specific serine/threonine protein kinase n=1 Tax=Maudiozyma barnettii TaxID=61262 RepID=A0A8H2VBS3_9SACH|nr:bifunctional endoribonuclease/protein kinase IRE1 [Kazachstania barnettii]CAB4252344.1 similar to Saccharomyces cerevisiae YHR079C IRE1 Serine-threonine kinase and endoribonuclease [Kazachstania barnettii]CAD1779078.1 similar to Saccharomyces cerevisiae YHR079C IRE1 Serine-threonine kinase and endoribonuclease [Kazachstania barnettii]